jgi:hypothetical protein
VRRELIESRIKLKNELGISECIFAYPFGGRSDISSEALTLVKDVGFAGCLSAYGGYLRAGIDPYDIPRIGINYKFTMRAFRARLEGFQS